MARNKSIRMAKMNKPLGPLTVIWWLDAYTESGWQEPMHYKGAKSISIGWLAQEDEQIVALTPNLSPPDQIGDVTVIPKGMIIARKVLPDPRQPKPIVTVVPTEKKDG